MQGSLSIKSVTVQNIYSQYLSGQYIINRRYQRKLVWTLNEKEKFIDSLINGYPIPMIIAANYKKIDDNTAFEILDGMQRLNAITSFIEGEFPVQGKHFDLEAVAQTKSKLTSGELFQREPVLSIEDCSKILDYPVPFSVCAESETEKVDESFRRINTGGRTLSKQDVRQAGALGIIPDLIRDASVYVRKDSSHSNILDLKNMKSISLSNNGLNYGICLGDIFWIKHGIITQDNVRKSRDEELIAHLVACISNPKGAQTTASYLDNIYDSSSTESSGLSKCIYKLGKDTVYKRFCFVFEEIQKTLNSKNEIFKTLVFKSKPMKSSLVFQVVFLAFYRALIDENLKIANYLNLCESLRGVYDQHLHSINSSQKWMSDDRDKLSRSILGVIKPCFSPKVGTDRNLSAWVENLENILNESKTEQVCYDFKMGLNKIGDGSGDFVPKTFSKVVKTLVAMTNAMPGDCFVIIGVAESQTSAEAHKSHYNSDFIEYNGFYITGIDGEANKYHSGLEKYELKLLSLIDGEPISDSFKESIKSNMVTFTYQDKEILLFQSSRKEEPEMYDNKFHTRTMSHINEVERTKEYEFFTKFKKQNELAPKI
ncbi:MAG: DUF262 domain-containing protein [Colwellia sp.]|jgi:Protein of unknown function DUF262.